jgi:hypothetical protein
MVDKDHLKIMIQVIDQAVPILPRVISEVIARYIATQWADWCWNRCLAAAKFVPVSKRDGTHPPYAFSKPNRPELSTADLCLPSVQPARRYRVKFQQTEKLVWVITRQPLRISGLRRWSICFYSHASFGVAKMTIPEANAFSQGKNSENPQDFLLFVPSMSHFIVRGGHVHPKEETQYAFSSLGQPCSVCSDDGAVRFCGSCGSPQKPQKVNKDEKVNEDTKKMTTKLFSNEPAIAGTIVTLEADLNSNRLSIQFHRPRLQSDIKNDATKEQCPIPSDVITAKMPDGLLIGDCRPVLLLNGARIDEVEPSDSFPLVGSCVATPKKKRAND